MSGVAEICQLKPKRVGRALLSIRIILIGEGSWMNPGFICMNLEFIRYLLVELFFIDMRPIGRWLMLFPLIISLMLPIAGAGDPPATTVTQVARVDTPGSETVTYRISDPDKIGRVEFYYGGMKRAAVPDRVYNPCEDPVEVTVPQFVVVSGNTHKLDSIAVTDCEPQGFLTAFGIDSNFLPKKVGTFPQADIDFFESQATIQLDIPHISPQPITLMLSGPTTIQRNAPGDSDLDGLPDIQTEILSLDLTGVDPILGPVMVRQSLTMPSRGVIEQLYTPGTNFPALSFFDVFVDIGVAGMPCSNSNPIPMSAVISDIPPARGTTYESPLLSVPIINPITGQPCGRIMHVSHVVGEPILQQRIPETVLPIVLMISFSYFALVFGSRAGRFARATR